MVKQIWRSGFKALGTDIEIQLVLEDENDKKMAEKVFAKIKAIYLTKQKIFSRFESNSELSKLNKNLDVFQRASPDMIFLAKRALCYNKASGGFYDPRIIGILEHIGYDKDFRLKDFSNIDLPPVFFAAKTGLDEELKIKNGRLLFGERMDFSGIAKGYITDCAAKFLKKEGWKNFLVDSGGDMFAAGKNGEGNRWRIEIEGVSREKLMLEISEKGIATSGISRKKWQIKGKKFHHLVNPKDPNNFSYALRTVSVIDRDTENADGRAKTLILMGKEKGLQFAKKNKIAAIFLDYKGSVLISPEAKRYIAV
jgi:FAD:protein FMN transferase